MRFARHAVRRGARGVAVGQAAALLLALAGLGTLPRLLAPQPAATPPKASSLDAGALGAFVAEMQQALEPLQKEVSSGHVIPNFGERAESIASTLVQKVGGEAAGVVEPAVDGALHALFLQQLILLRQQTVTKFERGTRPHEAVLQADTAFVGQAEELKRPGSAWSYEAERYALRAALEGQFKRDAALAEERVLSKQTQQSTVEIISRLQNQMESLQQRVQQMRAGSPVFLSSSYRIPGTPLQLITRYQQGRASFELSLNPDRDPANSEAGFVQGVGPANIGGTLSLGL